MATTALVFTGHSKERIIESIRSSRKYSIEKIILVTGEQESTGEMKAWQIAEELEKDLKPFFDVAITPIDKKDIVRAACQITKIIRAESSRGMDILINMSSSLRTFSVAAYISGCITGSRMITAIPKYDSQDNEIGIEEIIDLPALPINALRDEQIRILAALSGESTVSETTPNRKKDTAEPRMRNHSGVASLDELVLLLNPKIKKGSDMFAKERSRLSHHLKNFEAMGLVTKIKCGKNIEVRLTGIGEMFVFP